MSFLAAQPMQEPTRTVTLVETETHESSSSGDEAVGTLRLRAANGNRTREAPRVVWREDVVDNEGAGKKSSKICCIYHKPRRFDESSSDEDSSDSDDSDSSCDSRSGARHGRQRPSRPAPDTNGAGPSTRSRDGATVVHEIQKDGEEHNAYERQPGKKPNKSNKPIPQSKS